MRLGIPLVVIVIGLFIAALVLVLGFDTMVCYVPADRCVSGLDDSLTLLGLFVAAVLVITGSVAWKRKKQLVNKAPPKTNKAEV